MKKKYAQFSGFLIVFMVCFYLMVSCGKNTKVVSSVENVSSELSGDVEVATDNASNSVDNSIDIDSFFNDLDYRKQLPEKENVPKTISVKKTTDTNEKSSSVIPGIRDLSKYATDYKSIRLSNSEAASTADSSFSSAMDSSNSSTTSTGTLKASAPVSNANSDLESQTDEETRPLAISSKNPGKKEGDGYNWYYNSSTGLPPSRYEYLYIRFNYPITQDRVLGGLSITQSGIKDDIPFSAVPCFSTDDWGVVSVPETGKTNTFYIQLKKSLENNQIVTVKIKSSGDFFTYSTLKKFELGKSYRGSNTADKKNVWELVFSQSIDEKTVMDGIRISDLVHAGNDIAVSGDNAAANTAGNGTFEFSTENFFVEGNTLSIYNLPVSVGDSYRINITKDLKDIYGQCAIERNVEVIVPEYAGYAKFLDSGSTMLEAQFPHKILFEYMNAQKNSVYQLRTVENPLYTNIWNRSWDYLSSGVTEIDISKRNTRQFVELDLEPYLTNGYGFVRFDASIPIEYTDNYDGKEKESVAENLMVVQVTDLGVTVRLGMNKSLVMVRSLSTNKPVENASVCFCIYDSAFETPLDIVTPEVKTDENGLAIIEFSEDSSRRLFSDYSSVRNITILVKNGDDSVVFYPTSHYANRDNVYTANISGSYEPKQRTFLFCDRGIYKPGETITFRGIDRNQVLGSFIPYTGEYFIQLKKNSWDDDTVYELLTGTASNSGGFWGNCTLPADLEPGSYVLNYSRGLDKNSMSSRERLYFTVSYFERAKIQTTVTMSDETLYPGNTINAKVEASYLAGGALGGAEYSSEWFRQPYQYICPNQAYKNYVFGISDNYDTKLNIASDNGTLESDGTASISCKIPLDGKKGVTYRYRVEASVTDESNQKITGVQTKIVHPSEFYIGLSKPSGISGFAKKNQKLSFPYVVISPDGNKIESLKLINSYNGASSKHEAKVTLEREFWTISYQNSVDDSVYARYSKQTEVEYDEILNINSSGNIAVTPKNAGWYTLRVSSKDSKNHEAVSEYGFYATGGGASWFDRSDSASLNLTPDQSQYNPGDTAQILLESPLPSGDYLITVEREGVFTEEIRHFDEMCNVIDVKIASNYVPVVYVSVSSYSVRQGEPAYEYGEVDLDKPKGYFGVTPVFINPRIKAFSIDVETNESVYRPGETVEVKLTATKGGKPVEGAELTLMAVDRGVLDLVNYHVPDPIGFFYDESNFPLYVRGGDSRAYLMDPVIYSIKDLIGGDSAEEEKEEDIRKDFRPTACFEPVLITGKDGTATYSFKLPDSLTTYRITAFGVCGELLALQENEIAVQNLMNVSAVQPQGLRVRDTAECGVLITNLDNVSHDVTVSVSVEKPKSNSKSDEKAGLVTVPGNAIIDGDSIHTVHVVPGDSSVVYFDVAAVSSGNVDLVYSISSDVLNERLVSSISIEKTYVMETAVVLGSIEPDEEIPPQEEGDVDSDLADVKSPSAFISQGIEIPSFAEDNQGSISITLDATKLGLLGTAVNYVFKYPYGCLEQQTSQVLPLVVFEQYIDVFNLNSMVFDTRLCCKSFFTSWKKYQKGDGGFPYWPSGELSNFYVSLRIAHIYSIAKERGYTDSDFPIDIEALKNFIVNNIQKTDTDDYLKSYACYVMGKLGDNRLDGVLLSLEADVANRDLNVAAYTALAYLCKNTSEGKAHAEQLAAHIRKFSRESGRGIDITQAGNSTYISMFYNSRINQEALFLQLFLELNPKDEIVDRLLFTILQEQRAGYWKNTAVTSRVLESIYTFIQKRNLDAVDFTASCAIQQNPLLQGTFQGAGAKTLSVSIHFDEEPLNSLPRDTVFPLNIVMNGKGTLYYTAEMAYAIPDEMQTARNNGFNVSYKIIDISNGNEISMSKKDIYSYTLESGKTYKVIASISTGRNRQFVALRTPIPSGAEVLNAQLSTVNSDAQMSYESFGWGRYLSNMAIYDNEVRFFWNNFSEGQCTLEFAFRANRRGVYPVPPYQAECMYENEVFGRSDGVLYIIK